MNVKAGDKANKDMQLECTGCEGTVHVKKGDKIQACPCGSDQFAEKATAGSSAAGSSGSSSSSSSGGSSQHRK